MSVAAPTSSPDSRDLCLSFGCFRIDGRAAALFRHGQRVPLRPKCFNLLCLLVRRAGQVVSKDELLEQVWPGVVVTEDALTRAMSDLRDALGHPGQGAIRTVPKRGYLFDWPVLLEQAAVDYGADPLRPVGRDQLISDIQAWMAPGRVVTLVGPAGVGKSHLARWLLRSQPGHFEHGAAQVNLDQVEDAGQVVARVFASLGLARVGSRDVQVLVRAALPLKALVLLDNAEHLVEAVAEVAAALAAGAPGLRILVTSQRPLRIGAEQVVKLSPLEVPPDPAAASGMGTMPNAQPLAPNAAALELMRQRLAQLGCPAGAEDLVHLCRICRRTEGLPLAIELAAARVAQFGAARVAELLDHDLDLLDTPRRDAPTRHRSVRAAVQWSVDLLPPAARVALGRTGVFVGGFTLDAARQVLCDADLDNRTVLDSIGTLVDASLITHDPVRGRYGILEVVRQIAHELLALDSNTAEVRRRHLRYHAALFAGVHGAMAALSEPYDAWRERLLADADNARAAFRWADMVHDRVTAVDMAAGLALVMGGEWPQERWRLLEQAEPLVNDSLPGPVKARWLLAKAQAYSFTEPALAHGWAEQSAALFANQEDRPGRYLALTVQVHCLSMNPPAKPPKEPGALSTAYDSSWSALVCAEGANAIACWYSAGQDFARCISWRRRSLALYARAGCAWREHAAMSNLVDTLLACGEVDSAVAVGTELLDALMGTRVLTALPAVRLNLAAAHLRRGDPDSAAPLVAEGWAQAVTLGWQGYWADHLALMAVLRHLPEAAACLLGFGDARYKHGGADREVNEARAARQAQEMATRAIGVKRFEQLRHQGERLDDAGAASLVRALASRPPGP